MSSSINICKFAFAILICLVHCSMKFMWRPFGNQPWGLFQAGYIFVDWFYIFAGFTLARSIMNADKKNGVIKNSFKIFKKRFLRVYPIYVISFFIGLMLRYYFGTYEIKNEVDVFHFLCDFFTLRMLVPPSEISVIETDWFLSSMWLAFIIIIPLGLIFRRKLIKVSIVIASLIYLYIYITTKNLYGPMYIMPCGIYKGNIRAVAGITLGLFGYEISNFIRNIKLSNVICSMIISITYILVIIFTIFVQESPFYFILPYVFIVLITIQMDTQYFVKDNSFTRFLSELSMLIIFSHCYVIIIIEHEFKYNNNTLKLTLVFSITFIICMIINMINKVFVKRT